MCYRRYYGGGMPMKGSAGLTMLAALKLLSPSLYFFSMCLKDVFLALRLYLKIGKNLYGEIVTKLLQEIKYKKWNWKEKPFF